MRNSQLEILAQAQQYLQSVIKTDYTEIPVPNFMSSAGSHIRHIVDHYSAIMAGIESDIIDYDVRTRGSQIEECPEIAVKKVSDISNWINELSDEQLYKTVYLSTEVSIVSKSAQRLQTSIARELIFASSHAVHHFAMITQISIAQQKPLPVAFGIAPATATFIRQQSAHLT